MSYRDNIHNSQKGKQMNRTELEEKLNKLREEISLIDEVDSCRIEINYKNGDSKVVVCHAVEMKFKGIVSNE
jgi:hypothetical protein